MEIKIDPSIKDSTFVRRVYAALLGTAETAIAIIDSAEMERMGSFLRLHLKFSEYLAYRQFAVGDLSALLGQVGIFVQWICETTDDTIVELRFPSTGFSDIETPKRKQRTETKCARKLLALTPSLRKDAKRCAVQCGVSFNEFTCHAIERLVDVLTPSNK